MIPLRVGAHSLNGGGRGSDAPIMGRPARGGPAAGTRWSTHGMIDPDLAEQVAAALANCRGGRNGVPPVKNVLDMLRAVKGGRLVDEVMEDSRAAIAVVRAYDHAQIARLHPPATIAELEALLAADGPPVEILPDGSIRTVDPKAPDGAPAA
jgi:hypothetical protein